MTAPDWLRLNWGRWGADDQRGTLNYITPEVTQAAAWLVRRGATYDLGTTVETAAPRTAARLPTIRSTRGCGIGSWGGWCLSMGDDVTERGPRGGRAVPEAVDVDSPPRSTAKRWLRTFQLRPDPLSR